MKRTLTWLLLYSVASVAYADITVGAGSQSESNSAAQSNANSASIARGGNSIQGQNQGQDQGQYQQSNSLANANNANNASQSVNFNSTALEHTSQDIRYSGTTTQRFAPSVVGAVMPPSAVCMATYSVGGSGIGFGINVGISSLDKECERRETARTLQALGQADAAVSLMCMNPAVKEASPALCARVQSALGVGGGTPAPAPKAEMQPAAPVAATVNPNSPTNPKVGQVEKGSDGRSYRFTSQSGWQPIVDEPKPEAKPDTKAEAAVTQPLARNVYDGRDIVVQTAASKR